MVSTDHERFCGGVHFIAGALFAVMAAHNLLRWYVEKRQRNLVNALIYGPLVLFEMHHTRSHWKDTP